MALLHLTNIDLNGNQLLNAVIQNLGSDPGSPTEGQLWYNTATHQLKYYNGSATVVLYTAATAATASTVVLRDGSGDFAAHDITANKVTGLATPTGSSDAATKSYVDGLSNGLDWKASVRCASTANVVIVSALENGDAIDGVTLATGDRVLLKNQTTASENGIYVAVASGAASRSADADASAEMTGGLAVFVNEGTTNADTGWVLTTNDAITLGSTNLTFAQFTTAGGLSFTAPLGQSGNTVSLAYTARLTNNGGSLDLAAGVVSTGTYSSVTVDTYGRVTSGADIITSNGLVARTGSGTFANRTVTGTSNRVSVSNGSGASGDPTIDIDSAYVGQATITTLGTVATGTWSATTIALNKGGTGQTTAGAAFDALSPMTTLGDVIYGGASGTGTRLAGNTTTTKKFLRQTGNGSVSAAPAWDTLVAGDVPSGIARTYAADVGDASATSFVVTHNLGTRDVVVMVRDNVTPYAQVYCDVEATSTTTVTVRFAVAPASNKYRVVVFGG